MTVITQGWIVAAAIALAIAFVARAAYRSLFKAGCGGSCGCGSNSAATSSPKLIALSTPKKR